MHSDVSLVRRPALVAQGIEHRFPKPGVAGSNPAEGTPLPGMPGRASAGRFRDRFRLRSGFARKMLAMYRVYNLSISLYRVGWLQ